MEPCDTREKATAVAESAKPDATNLPDDIPGLIEALASPNKPPFEGEVCVHFETPPDFDETAQDRVCAAREKLLSMGIAAFPYLVQHADDPRYSYTACYSAYRNHSVGYACCRIIEKQIEPAYRPTPHRQSDGTHYIPSTYLQSQGDLTRWWASHSRMSLRELSIEATKWSIAQEERADFKTQEDRDRSLQPLRKQLRGLRWGKPLEIQRVLGSAF
jgi:hypothetical protein